jgi:ribosomal protein S18 acetylase RimI-like enzyme
LRPGRIQDLPQLFELWRGEVARGRQDIVPERDRLGRLLGRFDWKTRSRVVERSGRVVGSVLVMARPSPEGVLASVYAAGDGESYLDMVRWGVAFAKAAGASIIQLFVGKGRGTGLEGAGLRQVRPWLRMDRELTDGMPGVIPVEGYELVDGRTAADGSWSDLFNHTFADHWRFAPRAEEEIVGDKAAELCLMAVTAGSRLPVAISLGELASYESDPRPQPIGLISSVGTLPGHRRRGLANWLVAELLRRLQAAGARQASLYVDGLNATHADQAYRKLGFEVTYEAEVWEATLP